MIPIAIKYKAIVHYNHFCKSLRKVAHIYGISKSILHRWLKQSDIPIVRKHCKKKVKTQITNCINDAIKHNPSITCELLAFKIASDCNIKRSKAQVNRYMKHANYSYKKIRDIVDYKHNNSNILEFCNSYLKSNEDIVCIDEMGFYLGDHSKRGWSPKGKRLMIKSNKSLRREKMTVIMAVSSSGIVHYEILDHNCCKSDFIQFMSHPKIMKRCTYVMDNIRFHHSKEIKAIAFTHDMTLLYIPLQR